MHTSTLTDNAHYVFHKERFLGNIADLTKAFESRYPNFRLGYSFKTNYHPAVAQAVLEAGVMAEVVSPFEYVYAQQQGFDTSQIIYNGPIPDPTKLSCAVGGGIVNLDNEDEYRYMSRLAASGNSPIKIGLRVSFYVGNGIVSRFGTDKEFVNQLCRTIRKDKLVRCTGLHCHIGSSRQLQYWEEKAEVMVSLTKSIEGIERIDLGGGMFGPMRGDLACQFDGYVDSYDKYAEVVCSVMSREFPNHDVELVIEPGTALIGDCFDLVAPVIGIKEGFIVLGCSSHDIGFICEAYDMPIDAHESDARVIHGAVVGNTCLEGDIIKRFYSGRLAVGDVVTIPNCGAYSWSCADDFITEKLPVIIA